VSAVVEAVLCVEAEWGIVHGWNEVGGQLWAVRDSFMVAHPLTPPATDTNKSDIIGIEF
jgi:hypothetical protein